MTFSYMNVPTIALHVLEKMTLFSQRVWEIKCRKLPFRSKADFFLSFCKYLCVCLLEHLHSKWNKVWKHNNQIQWPTSFVDSVLTFSKIPIILSEFCLICTSLVLSFKFTSVFYLSATENLLVERYPKKTGLCKMTKKTTKYPVA